MPRPSPNYPRTLSPEYIEAYLANANLLARRCFLAQGLDGKLRTESREHAGQNGPDVLHVGRSRLLMGVAP